MGCHRSMVGTSRFGIEARRVSACSLARVAIGEDKVSTTAVEVEDLASALGGCVSTRGGQEESSFMQMRGPAVGGDKDRKVAGRHGGVNNGRDMACRWGTFMQPESRQ